MLCILNFPHEGVQLTLSISSNSLSNDTPILLLDDVFSELDITKRNKLLTYINKNIQTIITTTDLKNLSEKLINNGKIFYIKEGNIVKEK